MDDEDQDRGGVAEVGETEEPQVEWRKGGRSGLGKYLVQGFESPIGWERM